MCKKSIKNVSCMNESALCYRVKQCVSHSVLHVIHSSMFQPKPEPELQSNSRYQHEYKHEHVQKPDPTPTLYPAPAPNPYPNLNICPNHNPKSNYSLTWPQPWTSL